MTTLNPPTADTRRRILDAACRLFAEKGYRGATVAQICRAAQANIAAVNYHYGGKERLYQQSWRYAHDQILSEIPPDGGVAADRPPAARLRGRIRAGLQRALVGDAVEFRMMRHEMANPTGLLHQVIEDAIGPIRRATQEILREMLGPRASSRDIEWCEVSVVAPMMHVAHRREVEKNEGLAPLFREDMLEELADRLAAFAMAGVRQTRRQIEQSRRPPRPVRGAARGRE